MRYVKVSLPPSDHTEPSQVANHLTPAELLSLARANKFFRQIFMSQSSLYMWQNTFDNVPGMPRCPPNLCEPQYASLLFSKTCSVRGYGLSRLLKSLNRHRRNVEQEFSAGWVPTYMSDYAIIAETKSAARSSSD
jgi:hypothetical protein